MTDEWAAGYAADKAKEKEERQQEYPELPKFILGDGESKEFTFLTNGREINSEYGKAIVFDVNVDGVDHVWFVSEKKFMILDPVSEQMPVEGKRASLSRVGLKLKTRYTFKFLDVAEEKPTSEGE